MENDSSSSGPFVPQVISGRRFATDLDWNLLKTFHEIVLAGGISNAARIKARKQPALSMALKRLEEHLGTVLCHRGPSGFHLTHEGEMLAETCSRIFGSIANVPDRLASSTTEIRGRVRIQIISNLVDDAVDTCLRDFHQIYPAVEIFVTVSGWEVVPREVLRNAADIGMAPSHMRLQTLHYEPFFKEVYQAYCGRSHPLFGRTFMNPRDLSPYGLIHTGIDEPAELMAYRSKFGIGRTIAGLAERIEEARRLALLSVGVCFLPEAFTRSDVIAGRLHPLLETENVPSSEIYLISNPEAPPHRARDKLLDLIRSRL